MRLWLAVAALAVAALYNSSVPTMAPSGSPWLGYLQAKAGHVVEYALLGTLLFRALVSRRAGFVVQPRLAVGVTIAIGASFAALDETRQLFVYGRTGQVADVVLDTVALAASAVATNRWALGQPRRFAPHPEA